MSSWHISARHSYLGMKTCKNKQHNARIHSRRTSYKIKIARQALSLRNAMLKEYYLCVVGELNEHHFEQRWHESAHLIELGENTHQIQTNVLSKAPHDISHTKRVDHCDLITHRRVHQMVDFGCIHLLWAFRGPHTRRKCR